jgi:ATP-dependent phosphoenolpyruvate carboxykinase
METKPAAMTGIEKLRKLVVVKKEAEQEVCWRYKNDPEYRAIFERLEEKNRQENTANTL